ncbi:hypothetical protein LOTGIDRAFT_233686 [Lottia gigantea]|uniref:Uncharacterized protein n=1 Tax=Lottia gigantea TaxID=225164 RepID=V4ABI8_LOTGI|nr:hypothetical protein LOTGIDRAFT_233686 [Lottia gigantea]ESO90676.1 hypothetical protein LOTGIDRAFT_233686 [Lottia gigantea]
MATGHILPGYGNPVSRLRRVRHVGYPIENDWLLKMKQETNLDRSEFEMIRAKARHVWSKPDREKTTYRFHYNGDEIGSLVPRRPTSPTRRNNPHPPVVFLHNKLHQVGGYDKPDTSINYTTPYQVDGSEGLSPIENHARKLTRSKYLDRPSTAAINQYRDDYRLKEFLEPTAAQATQAFLNQANQPEKDEALQRLEDQRFQYFESQKYGTSPRAQTAYPSTYRWMKIAGPNENYRLNGVPYPENIQVNPPLPGPLELLGLRRCQNKQTKRPQLRFNSARGDYSIHPDWPPSIPHHFVP